MSNNILVTRGAGYIGSQTVLQLLLGGYTVVVADNLDNSSAVHSKEFKNSPMNSAKTFLFARWTFGIDQHWKSFFSETKFDVVIHFAGLKAVGESVETITLL